MSETLNVNVLVAAKEEYTRQLISTIQHDIYFILKSIFNDSQERNLRRAISYSNFQLELKEVPQWTSYKLDSKIQELAKKYPFLMDLITAIFVSHVKILACVRLKSDNKSIKIKVPNLNTFLHKLLIKCCETLYYEPQTINFEKHAVIQIISDSIEDTIANQIPIEYILSEYLAGAFDEEPNEPINLENAPEVPHEETPEEEISDNESDANSEEGEFKNIPILPIKNRAGFQESLNTVPDSSSINSDSNNNNNISDVNTGDVNLRAVENEPKNEPVINKSSKIDDNSDEEYSDEDISADELSDDEDSKVKKNRSLF